MREHIGYIRNLHTNQPTGEQFNLPQYELYHIKVSVLENLNTLEILWLNSEERTEKIFFKSFFIYFDGYYIVRTDEGQPRPKYIFNKCGTNIYFFYSTEVWSITITEFFIFSLYYAFFIYMCLKACILSSNNETENSWGLTILLLFWLFLLNNEVPLVSL